MDLIDRDAVLSLPRDVERTLSGEVVSEMVDIKLIEALLSAQPQIIRCKECRHSEYDAMYNDRYCHYNGKAEIVGDEHFCGYGKRRPE